MGSRKQHWLSIVSAFAFFLALSSPMTRSQAQSGGNSSIIPPNAKVQGLSYAEWSARWWQWALELHVPGHPALSCPDSISAGQSGQVWFLASGPSECAGMVPAGTALFIPLVNVECSSLEPPAEGFYGGSEADQRSCAKFWADHIVKASLFCEIDGAAATNLSRYRFASPQIEFVAPSPWLFGEVGGPGTSVGDGYFVLLHPLSKGQHTVRFGGDFHFSIAEGDEFDADFGFDTTYHLNVK